MKDMTPGTFLRLLAIVLVGTFAISIVMANIDWNGMAGSEERIQIDRMLDVSIILSAFVFMVVMVMMGYAVWKYRAKPGDESDGEPIHGNTRLEIIWTAIPTLIVLVLGIYSTIVLSDIEAKASNAMRVNITAQQFAWRFDYVEAGKTSTELHVPAGTQLDVKQTALDVLHSFWVPEWGIKRDLVPGASLDDEEDDQDIDNTFVVTPTVPGTYQVICMELCGLGHSTMRATAVVHESQEEFDAWLNEQRDLPEDGAVSTGAAGGSGAGSLAEE
jgi:cytochrome c oxidase subunit 2